MLKKQLDDRIKAAEEQEKRDAALKKALDDAKGKDLAAALAAVAPELKGAANPHVAAAGVVAAAIDDKAKAAMAVIDDPSKSAAEKKAAYDGAKVECEGLIKDKFKFEFGALASDILLKGSDIGLKGGLPMIGGDPARVPVEDHQVEINALDMKKYETSSRLKLAKIDLKMKEYEAQGLAAGDPKAAALQAQIADLDAKVKGFEREVDTIDAAVTKLRSV